jgi:hypothetical protein
LGVASGGASTPVTTLVNTASILVGSGTGTANVEGQVLARIANLVSGLSSGGSQVQGEVLTNLTSFIPGSSSGGASTSPVLLSSLASILSGSTSAGAVSNPDLIQVVSSLLPGRVLILADINEVLDNVSISINAWNQADSGLQSYTYETIFFGSITGYKGIPVTDTAKIGFGIKTNQVSNPSSNIYLDNYPSEVVPVLEGGVEASSSSKKTETFPVNSEYYTDNYETTTIPDLPNSIPVDLGVIKAPPSTPP